MIFFGCHSGRGRAPKYEITYFGIMISRRALKIPTQQRTTCILTADMLHNRVADEVLRRNPKLFWIKMGPRVKPEDDEKKILIKCIKQKGEWGGSVRRIQPSLDYYYHRSSRVFCFSKKYRGMYEASADRGRYR